MFIGHYAASFAARRAHATLPLWLLVGAAQLLDIVWALLVLVGVERVAPDPVLGLVFLSHPYSHSLAAAAAWALAAAIVARIALRIDGRGAAILAAVVLSHWFLDLIVHRPDLPLWPGGAARLGLGLWTHPAIALVTEIALFLAAGLWVWQARIDGALSRGRLLAFLGFGAVLMPAMNAIPPPAEIDAFSLGAIFLFVHLLFVFLAWLVERGRPGVRAAQCEP